MVSKKQGWVAARVERVREREEERRRLEQQRAKEIADCEKEAFVLWQQLGMSLAIRQRIRNLENYRDFVASLRSVVHHSQRLHDPEVCDGASILQK